MTRTQLSELKRNPATRYALKSYIEQAEQRDPLDALKDAETLLEACKLFCREAGLEVQS